MKKVRLWSVSRAPDGVMKAEDVPDVDNAETERLLEDLLVQSPELLMDNLSLIGRQVPTGGGSLDLLGIDEDGGLVVFELKRGTLTRDAVAQVLDYASDVAEIDFDRFSKMVEESSGKNGVESIDDFADYYAQNFPNRESVFETPPRMMLVGLGVDQRALRIVNFLANSGVNITLLTFNAFNRDGTLFLARQVESAGPAPTPPQPSWTKEANLRILKANARALDVEDLIERVADYVEKRTPAYRWPGRTTYSFGLTEHTDQGRPSLRVYLNVSLPSNNKGVIDLVFQERATKVLGESLDRAMARFPKTAKKSRRGQVEFQISSQTWGEFAPHLETLLAEMVEGWKKKTSAEGRSTEESPGEVGRD
jgi:hypothetical protein